jgi:hypothetical protein
VEWYLQGMLGGIISSVSSSFSTLPPLKWSICNRGQLWHLSTERNCESFAGQYSRQVPPTYSVLFN